MKRNSIKEFLMGLLRKFIKNPSIKTEGFEFSWVDGEYIFKITDELKEEISEYFGGALDGLGEDDVQFGSVDEIEKNMVPPLYKFRQSKKMYNQLDTGKMDCTLYAALTARSNLLNVDVDIATRKDIKKIALERGHSEKDGWYLHKAVQLIKDYFGDVNSYTVPTGSKEFYAVLKKYHVVILGYHGNSKYNKDVEEDGVLGGTSFGKSTYSHAITATYIPSVESICFIDNYKGLKRYNVYKVKEFDALLNNGVFFKNSFYFTAK